MNGATNYDTWLTTDTTDTLDPCDGPAIDMAMVAAPCLKRGCNDLQDPGNKRGFCWQCQQDYLDKVDSFCEQNDADRRGE